jgi:hypothetical protein
VPLHLNGIDMASWILGACLDASILLLILFRKPVRQLGFFTAYFIALIVREFWWYYTSRHLPDIRTHAYELDYAAYWGSELLLSLLRLATCVQIWWLAVRRFPAIWKLSWRALALISSGIFAWTITSAYLHRNWRHNWITQFFYAGLQRFELMQAIGLVIILAFGVYYAVDFKPGHRAFLIGFCAYSLVQCVTSTISYQNPIRSYEWFSISRELAFDVILCVWIYAASRLVYVPREKALAHAGIYDQLAPELNFRLRQLNNQLAGILHS